MNLSYTNTNDFCLQPTLWITPKLCCALNFITSCTLISKKDFPYQLISWKRVFFKPLERCFFHLQYFIITFFEPPCTDVTMYKCVPNGRKRKTSLICLEDALLHTTKRQGYDSGLNSKENKPTPAALLRLLFWGWDKSWFHYDFMQKKNPTKQEKIISFSLYYQTLTAKSIKRVHYEIYKKHYIYSTVQKS